MKQVPKKLLLEIQSIEKYYLAKNKTHVTLWLHD